MPSGNDSIHVQYLRNLPVIGKQLMTNSSLEDTNKYKIINCFIQRFDQFDRCHITCLACV